jgi:hypothetical protein
MRHGNSGSDRHCSATVSKILKLLVNADVLISARRQGGYALAECRKNQCCDSYQRLEGPIALTECSIPAGLRAGFGLRYSRQLELD